MDFIIDFEFNGLPAYNFKPEIIQAKLMNFKTGECFVENYSSRKTITAGAKVCLGMSPCENVLPDTNGYFTKGKFVKLLKKANCSITKDTFYGFSIKTDVKILASYGITIDNYIDLQNAIRLTRYEKQIALEGSSLEAVCHITGCYDARFISHSSVMELQAISNLYTLNATIKHKQRLTLMPWGESAGMPIEKYCKENRRRADGYRYNNADILAEAFNYYCSKIDQETFDNSLDTVMF